MSGITKFFKQYAKKEDGPSVESPKPTIKPESEAPKPVDIDDATPWMTVAHRELGVKETKGKDNPRIIEYHKSTTLDKSLANEQETPWCSSFVTWCLEQAGQKSMDSAWARSYLNYGEKITKPKYGAVVVFSRGTSSGHVAFYLDETKDSVLVLGGNQGNAVTKAWYPKSRLLGYRWPVVAVKKSA